MNVACNDMLIKDIRETSKTKLKMSVKPLINLI